MYCRSRTDRFGDRIVGVYDGRKSGDYYRHASLDHAGMQDSLQVQANNITGAADENRVMMQKSGVEIT